MKPDAEGKVAPLPVALLFCGILFDTATLIHPPLALGAPDGLRMRLFRLARVAAVALPLLAVFFSGLAARIQNEIPMVRRANRALLFGAATMPLVLAAAAFTRLECRMLLPLPALAIVYGVVCAASIARQRAAVTEVWGWRLVAASTAAGLVMGLYAFDAPFLGAFAGPYDGALRAAIRVAHEGAILIGMALILLSRAFESKGVVDENRAYRYRRRQAADA
jgi:hypothetical protein